MERVKNGENLNNLIIFAEGTTTNGSGLLPFKKGAFVAGGPVKMCALKYSGRVNPSYLMMKPLDNLFAMLTNLTSGCTLIEGDSPIYKQEGVGWQEFAE